MAAFIFDLDGTLVDTKDDMLDAGNLIFEELGWKVRLEGFLGSQVAVQGGRSILRYGLNSESLQINDKVLKDLYQLYLRKYEIVIDKKSKVYDGVIDTLSLLTDENVKLGLCTNKPEKQARILLERIGLNEFFKESFIGSDTVGVAKPSPKPLLESVKRLQTEPQEVFFVGDTNTDEKTAKAAYIKFIFCNYGHGSLYKIASGSSAFVKINKFNEILALITD